MSISIPDHLITAMALGFYDPTPLPFPGQSVEIVYRPIKYFMYQSIALKDSNKLYGSHRAFPDTIAVLFNGLRIGNLSKERAAVMGPMFRRGLISSMTAIRTKKDVKLMWVIVTEKPLWLV
mmetsp:Transcript_5005/g.12119  ORF Transcript_5005/g.12119 Transcript_5005/m.12119 type:complete len:121 (-) Transcript_5005:119-481(-)